MIGVMVPNSFAWYGDVGIHMFELCTDYGVLDIKNKLCTLTKDVPHTIYVGPQIYAKYLDKTIHIYVIPVTPK